MRNVLLAIFSGLLLMFSFPTVLFGWRVPDLGIIGWVALVPLFISIYGERPAKAYLLTFVAGLVWFGGSLYWIFNAVHVYGGLGVAISIVTTVLLVVVLSAYVALAPMLARWISLYWKGEMIVFLPVLWVAIALARSHVPMGGFPWSNIAMSQWSMLVPIQMIDVFGIYGLIFVMVWVNWFIAELILRLNRVRVRWVVPKLVITVIILISVMGYGIYRMRAIQSEVDSAEDTLSIGLVQGNIPQDEKWNPRYRNKIMGVYRRWTAKLFDAGADLIVWPEASFPMLVWEKVESADPRAFGFIDEIVGNLPALMFGAIVEGDGTTAYNSALMFDSKGKLTGRYDKMHLVPFGEYVPYRNLLFFARKLTAPVGDFEAGQSTEPLVFEKARLGPLICYEDVFPDISRDFVRNGADVLVNLTNDAWYGFSSAPYQHLALSVFRAVENRRYMIRSTNTGVSAVISPTGDVLMDSPLFEQSVMVTAIKPLRSLSFYTAHGDWFAYACVAYSVLGLIIATVLSVRRRKERV